MARRVLGNDPFQRSAAARPGDAAPAAAAPPGGPAPAAPAPAAPPAAAKPTRTGAPTKAAPARSGTPAAARPGDQHSPTPHGAPPAPRHVPTPHAGSPRPGPDPVPHPASPTAGADPKPHAGSPVARHVPAPHAASPRPGPDPVPHPASPTAGADPRPHPQSPTATRLPTPHEASPRLGPDPVPHEASPTVQQGPVAHAASPRLGADPVPHAESPRVAQGPVPHPGSPAVVERPAPAPSPAEPPSPTAPPPPSAPRTTRGVELGQALSLARAVLSSGASVPVLGAAKGLFYAARAALGLGPVGEVDAWGRDEALGRALHPVADFLYDRYWRVAVEGEALLPAGAALIVANHSGALPFDGPMLRQALARHLPDEPEPRWLLEDQVFHAPFLGVLANRLGAVRANPDNALRLLAEGRKVIVFPEGIQGLARPYHERYQLRRFGRGGFVKIALRAGVPIVPTAVVGAEDAMPLLGLLPGGPFGVAHVPLTTPPLPARWFIRFGEPLTFPGTPASRADDLAWVQGANTRTREAIEGLLTDLLNRRESVF